MTTSIIIIFVRAWVAAMVSLADNASLGEATIRRTSKKNGEEFKVRPEQAG